MQTSHNQNIGSVGEQIASDYLITELKMSIIERNWRKQSKELDIIAIEGNTLRIVEVKSRMESSEESVTNSLTDRKLQNLTKGASLYLSTFNISGIDEIFFDLVIVIFKNDGSYSIEYIPKFFFPSW
ncbi:MAG: YraN family protein [Rikenellaceae bacterium]